ncbi:MAG: restriction endonuclease [Deltaproteobacteria bacterium]|nr:restriction endonuclease [Deltaproteobacteria bacterium]
MTNAAYAVLLQSFWVSFLGIFLGFLVIILIIKGSKKNSSPQEKALQEAWKDWDFNSFYSKVSELLEKMGLEIETSYRDKENSADILAKNPTPLIGGPVIAYVHFNPKKGAVSSVDVINFGSNLVGDRKGKGLYITNGNFAPEVAVLPELPPMDLIDGKQLKELFEKYAIFSKEELKSIPPQ